MAHINTTWYNLTRLSNTQTNLDGDDFIYTDTVDSGWIGGAEEDYVLQTGDTPISLSSLTAQSDKTFTFTLFEGTEYDNGSGTLITPFRLNRNKTGKPLTLIDARKNPTVSNTGTQVYQKNFLVSATAVFGGNFAAVSFPLGIIAKPNTNYLLRITNSGDATPGTLEFDLKFTSLGVATDDDKAKIIVTEAP